MGFDEDETLAGDCSSLGEDLGSVKRDEIYADLLLQGYRFRSNYSKGSGTLGSDIRDYEMQGLEVYVHKRAFWNDGTEDRGAVAILTRSRTAQPFPSQ